jgi:hypothetical protein
MNKMTETLCTGPFISMSSTPNGIFRPCCSPYDFGESSSLGSIDKSTYEEAVNHKTNMNIRKAMLNGEKHYLCTRCYMNEDAGSRSLRQNTNALYENDKYFKLALENTDADGRIDPKHIYFRYWDLRFSNICNFGCRMCSPGNSSFLMHEEFGNSKKVFKFSNRENIWNDLIEKRIRECDMVYFAGGEPMLMKEHWLFLDKLIEHEMFDVLLKYNSNMSTLTYAGKNAVDYWKKFKRVRHVCSIDDYGTRAEYWRYGTKWSEVLANMHIIEDMFGKVTVSCAFNLFNAINILDFAKYLNSEFKFVDFDLNYVFTPWYNVQLLPKALKQKVIDDLTYIKEHRDEFPNIKYIGRLDATIYNIKNEKAFNTKQNTDTASMILFNRKKLIEETERMDKLRNQNYQILYPKLAEMIADPRFLVDASY